MTRETVFSVQEEPEIVESFVINGHDAFLVIDSTINGRSCGGLRLSPGIGLQEITDLAVAMTIKHGFLGIARGGAKAGIAAPEDLPMEQKKELICAFGKKINKHLIGRKYLSGPDVATTSELIDAMYESCGVPIPKRSTGSPNSSWFTSLSVFYAVKETLSWTEKTVDGSTFAVEGFGSVGSALAKQLSDIGGKILAVSTSEGALYDPDGLDIDELLSLSSRRGWITTYEKATPIPIAELLELPVDVLCPCALDSSINSGNMTRIRAPRVCSGANNPITLVADEYLFEKGVTYLPDFATNCGGVLGNAMEFASLSERHIRRIIEEEIVPKWRSLWESAKAQSRTPRSIGVEIALDTFSKMKDADESGGGQTKLFRHAVDWYRKGLIPRMLVKRASYAYFRKCLLRDRASRHYANL